MCDSRDPAIETIETDLLQMRQVRYLRYEVVNPTFPMSDIFITLFFPWYSSVASLTSKEQPVATIAVVTITCASLRPVDINCILRCIALHPLCTPP